MQLQFLEYTPYRKASWWEIHAMEKYRWNLICILLAIVLTPLPYTNDAAMEFSQHSYRMY